MVWRQGEYELTDDPRRVDLDAVATLLRNTYWAHDRPCERIATTIENSIAFSLFHREAQIGFARALTDVGAQSYVCDVVLDDRHRSHGIGTWLMERILDHPTVRGTRVFLITRDAQPFYHRLGFVTHPYECMVLPEPRPKPRGE